jgi:hypothetical protein
MSIRRRPREKLSPARRRERMARDVARLATIAGHLGKPRGAALLVAGATGAAALGHMLAALVLGIV